MAVTLPLDTMSVEEKLQAMESIWDDLCKKADSLSSPPWHEKILNEREGRLKRGEDQFVDWEEAKNNIRNDIS
ncbi:MAG: addiction module protein [Gammaproteobacteria bacterium]|nr:addiction module protein [Gammaproteobacteria bacterium]MCF6362257.1 addiction module protein [Gammaproteobacteria bacterium]